MIASRRQRGTKCAHLLGPCEFPGGEFTIDRKRTAQFEHTCLVTDDGVEVLTAGDDAVSPSAPWDR